VARLLTGIMADVTPAKGFSLKNRVFSFLELMTLCGLIITVAAAILAVYGFVDLKVVLAGVLVFLLAAIAIFMIALLSKNDQDTLWVFDHKTKIQAVEALIQMSDDWSIQKKDPAVILAGPAGIFLIFDKAELESQNLAVSNANLRENALSVCHWAQVQIKKAIVNVTPRIVILTDFPNDQQYDFLPFSHSFLKPSDLGAYLGKLPRAFDSSELARFQAAVFEGAVGPLATQGHGRIERRSKSGRSLKSKGRTSSKLAGVVLALMIIGGILYGAYQLKPLYFQQFWYIAKYWVGETAPEMAKTLRLPISQSFSAATIQGNANGVVDVYPRISGGTPQGRFQSGEKLDILERDFDSLQEPWLYVQNSHLDGWIKQDHISFDYLKAGTSVYTESDLNVGVLSVLSHDVPAIAVRHRYQIDVSGSGWWEFLTPGLQKIWVKSDDNPLINPGGGN